MAHWQWDPTFSVGINVIDNQHKQIIDYINELNVAYAYDKKYMVEEVLKKLLDYTNSHFSFEEGLMEEADYPHLTQHKLIHHAFVERIEFFKERYENGEDISKQLKMDLQIWLINHIQKEDFDYKDCVHKILYKHQIDPTESNTNSWLEGLLKKFF